MEGGAPAERDGGGVHGPVGALVPAGVDADGREQDLRGHHHVRRREAEVVAPALSAGDDAPHLVVAPQQGCRRGDVAGGEEAPDGGGRHRPVEPGPLDQAQAHDVEAELGAQTAQEGDVAAAPVTEVEVLPHDHQARPERLHEDLGHEVLRILLRPGLVEGDDHGGVDVAGGGQRLQLLVEVGQQLRRALGPHDHGRVAVEGDDRRRQAGAGGQPPQLGQHRLVAAVDPVEGADGDGRPRRRPGPRPQIVDHLHQQGKLQPARGFPDRVGTPAP